MTGKEKYREDTSVEKRVELHAHTSMTSMEGIVNVKHLIQTAKRFGHKAIAVTDDVGTGFSGCNG